MKTIEDVRIALWQAYRKAYQSDNDLYVKNAESICEVNYPSINHFDLESESIPDEFLEPKGLKEIAEAVPNATWREWS